jgi:hypothetical protein
VNVFINDYHKWAQGIIAASRLSRKNNLVEILREYDLQKHAPEVTPRDILYSLLCLLHLLPSTNTRQKGRKSSVELENCFLTFQSPQTSIELFLAEKANSDQHKQPFIMCLGSKEQPTTFFLILDKKAVCLGECGILRAVDCLFKAHFVYWVDYAKPLCYFMEFLHKVIYNIDCKKMSSCVKELRTSIVALMESPSGSDN